MRTTDTHIYFWGSIYSNFYMNKDGSYLFQLDAEKWMSSEQYFMYQKSLTFNDMKTCEEILNTKDPYVAKKLGRKIKNYNDDVWSEMRFNIMKTSVFAKFSQNETLKNEILNTGNKIFVEASPFDKIWGVGLYEDDYLILNENTWRGLNLLGKVLIEVRDKLRQ